MSKKCSNEYCSDLDEHVLRCSYCHEVVNDLNGGIFFSYAIRWYNKKKIVVCQGCEVKGKVPPTTEADYPDFEETDHVRRKTLNPKKRNERKVNIQIENQLLRFVVIGKNVAKAIRAMTRTMVKYLKLKSFKRRLNKLIKVWGKERALRFAHFIASLLNVFRSSKYLKLIEEWN